MFFKHIMVLFIILGILGYVYGDRIFYFQATMMLNWQYDFPAYEAFERIIHYYPNSPHKVEAQKWMEILPKRNSELRNYLQSRDSELRKREKDRSSRESFH